MDSLVEVMNDTDGPWNTGDPRDVFISTDNFWDTDNIDNQKLQANHI